MDFYTEFFEFIAKLIDIQIKKYVSLAAFGVGPDVRLDAKLVLDEVNELLGFAEQLLDQMKKKTCEKDAFIPLFNQVTFYMEQEYSRSRAGWLLSENNIHNTLQDRLVKQLDQLNRIAETANISFAIGAKPVTDVQKQCEHDSAAIAFRILDLAHEMSKNPNMELPENFPNHARSIMKANAITRYRDKAIAPEIESLCTKYRAFLDASLLTTNAVQLSKEEAEVNGEKHRAAFNALLAKYKEIKTESTLFSANPEWYAVGGIPKPTAPSSAGYSVNKSILFNGGIALGVLCVSALLCYFQEKCAEDVLHVNFAI